MNDVFCSGDVRLAKAMRKIAIKLLECGNTKHRNNRHKIIHFKT
jgi:hypothetical protein